MSKGLATITLLDNTDKPLAERMFFAHYDQRPEIIIKTGSIQYFTRQKVQLSFQLKDTNGKARNGVVSVACVQDNRIDLRKMNDIESYIYLSNELEDLPFKHNALSSPLADNEYMEDVLLIKGWRRYTWTDMMTAKATDTTQPKETLIFKGIVTRNTKSVNKKIELGMIADSVFNTIRTDKSGNFELAPPGLIVPPDQEIVLFINQKNQALYKLNMPDIFYAMNEKLAKKMTFENFDIKTKGENSETMLLKSDERVKVLTTVIIKSIKIMPHFRGYNSGV